MTEARIRKLIKHWQDFLGLQSWEITLDLSGPCEEGVKAMTWRTDQYDTATMILASDWREWDNRFANRLIVHELLHLVSRDLDEAMKSALSFLHDFEQGPVAQRFDHEMEGVIDRMAERLVTLAFD